MQIKLNRLIAFSTLTFGVTATVLWAQGTVAPLCYDALTYAGTQQGPCSAYCECPGNTLCAAPAGGSVGGVISSASVPCVQRVGGTLVGGRCIGGVATTNPPSCGPAAVFVQACTGTCQGGGGEN